MAGKAKTPEDRVKEMLAAGETRKAIATALGISQFKVDKIRVAAGLKTQPPKAKAKAKPAATKKVATRAKAITARQPDLTKKLRAQVSKGTTARAVAS